MSFNYLEVQRFVSEFSATKGHFKVLSVELVQFKLPAKLPDLNLGFLLEDEKGAKSWLVFSFKSPWAAVFFQPSHLFEPERTKSGLKAFPNLHILKSSLEGRKLELITAKEKDRILFLKFSGHYEFTVELFSARPNWHLKPPQSDFIRWREPAPVKQIKENAEEDSLIMRIRNRGRGPLVCREFENVGGSEWLDRSYHHYKKERVRTIIENALQEARQKLDARLSKFIRLKTEILKQLKDCAKAEQLKVSGEALKSVLYQYPKNRLESRVTVHWGGDELSINLDPQKTVSENAEKFFVRYKKLTRTKQEVEPRLKVVDEQVTKLKTSLQKLVMFRFQKDEDLEEIWKSCLDTIKSIPELPATELKSRVANKLEKKYEKANLKNFTSKEGMKIWIGRNHAENEQLVVRLARGNDIWLHLKTKPGAHAIIQVPKTRSASLETLLDAATLVAHYSGQSIADKVEVDYTFRKNVKRVAGGGEKGNGKFLVTYTQNKTLNIKIDKSRLDRLLASGL